MLDALSILVALTAVFACLNTRYLKLSSTIAMMASGIVVALLLVLMERFGVAGLTIDVTNALVDINFGPTLMNVVIGFLLFTSAMKINLSLIHREQALILLLALFSTLLNTFLIGGATWLVLSMLQIDAPILHCLLFGALISPTDPIATVAILKSVGLPPQLEALIEGESLLNDGVGAVVFAVLLGILVTGQALTFNGIAWELARDVGGGIILGIMLGGVAGLAARSVDALTPRVLLSLAVVFFGGFCARSLHVSYPLSMVLAGVCLALLTPHSATDASRTHLRFFKICEDVLVATLFALLGLMAILPLVVEPFWLAILLLVPLTLVCRFVSVRVAMAIDGRPQATRDLPALLTWGGLRGAISVALVLSLPADANRDLFLQVTYVIVLMSVLLQAPTIGMLFPSARLENLVAGLSAKQSAPPDDR